MPVGAFVSRTEAQGGADLRGLDRRDWLQHADRTRHELRKQIVILKMSLMSLMVIVMMAAIMKVAVSLFFQLISITSVRYDHHFSYYY
jgi:accessory gene regulator protein AgrB